jgi:hypothetical protein
MIFETEKKDKNKKFFAASKIQCLVRGVLGRRSHTAFLPYLQNAALRRIFCIECEKKISTRRCLDCKDRYCDKCYDKVHKKGFRKQHSWLPMASLSSLSATQRLAVEDATRGLERNQHTEQLEVSTLAVTDQFPAPITIYEDLPLLETTEWDLFFDDSAQANYWFNNVTGEASWINPNPMLSTYNPLSST